MRSRQAQEQPWNLGKTVPSILTRVCQHHRGARLGPLLQHWRKCMEASRQGMEMDCFPSPRGGGGMESSEVARRRGQPLNPRPDSAVIQRGTSLGDFSELPLVEADSGEGPALPPLTQESFWSSCVERETGFGPNHGRS